MDRPNRRRARRWNVLWPAVATYEGRQYPCTILDLSERGARLESFSGPLPKGPLKLQSERFGSLDGRLIWTKGRLAGMGFAASPAEIVRLLKPMVPGLDRKEQSAAETEAAAPAPSARPTFGRKPRPVTSDPVSGPPVLPVPAEVSEPMAVPAAA